MAGGSRAGQREAVLAALLQGRTQEQAAAAGKVSVRTVRNWLTDPPFLAELRSRRRQLLGQTVALLHQLSAKAILTVNELLDSDKPAVRCRTALGVLDGVLRSADLADALAEVDELRALVGRYQHDLGTVAATNDGTAGHSGRHPADRGADDPAA